MSELSPDILPPQQELQITVPASPIKRLVVGLVLLAVVVAVLGVFQLNQARREALEEAGTTGRMLTETLQQTIGEMIRNSDLAVQNVVGEIDHQSATGGIDSKTLERFIERQYNLIPELEGLRITDASGMITLGSGRKPTVRVSVADRDYFIYLKGHPEAGLFIAKPHLGKISNNNVVSCVRRITLPDGSFGGVVYGALPLQRFSDLFKKVPVGHNGAISLRRDDLSLVTRFSAIQPDKHKPATDPDHASEAWRSLLSQGKTENGSYTTESGPDDVRRIHSYLRVSRYPLYVNVGLAQDDVLEETRQEMIVFAGSFFFFLFLACVLVWQLQRNWQRSFTAKNELRRNFDRLILMQEVSQYHATTVQDLLDFSLGKVIALTESSIGYIYYYHEEKQEFELNTWSKGVMEACNVAEPQSTYHLDKTGLWGEVVRQRRPIMVNDYPAASELKKGYPQGHVQLSRFLSIPIFDIDRIVAVVGVANKAEAYDQSDVLQLTLMMEGVWKITSQLMLEEQVVNSAHEWQSTFDSISDSIALIDTGQRVIRCNRATCTLLGREFIDIIGQPCWSLFHAAEVPIPDCPMVKAQRSLHSETATIRHNDLWLEVTVDPQLSDTGILTGAVHIVRDVTDRVKLINSIHEEKALYKDLVDTQPAGMYRLRVRPLSTCSAEEWWDMLTSHYSVDMATERYCSILGIDLPAFRENPGMVAEVIFQEDRADFVVNNIRAITDLTLFKWEGRITKEENIRWVRFESVPRKLDNGDVLWTGVVTDITEYKQAEESIREMQAQMMQNDKLATIGQLAAGVAHEINNPMGFIGSNMVTLARYIEKYNRYIEQVEQELCTLSSGELPEQVQALRKSFKMEYVMRDISVLIDESNEGIERVKRIVQDLRTFSRADSSANGSADLNSCMDSTINIVINEIKYAAEIRREYGDLPKVVCNAQQINQVFMNLLVNAAHAIQAKGQALGEIVIRSWSDTDNVFVSISDSGCGIAPENCKKIFDAFFTTKEVGKGTGLGLSISANIIRKHGGEISLASEVGVGTTFTIRLPLVPLPQVEGGQQ